MGIASLVLGIISLIVSFIPCCGSLAIIPAIIALILGIVEVVKKGKAGEPKGKGIAGIVLSAIAIVIIVVWFVIFGAAAATTNLDSDDILNSYSSYYDYDY